MILRCENRARSVTYRRTLPLVQNLTPCLTQNSAIGSPVHKFWHQCVISRDTALWEPCPFGHAHKVRSLACRTPRLVSPKIPLLAALCINFRRQYVISRDTALWEPCELSHAPACAPSFAEPHALFRTKFRYWLPFRVNRGEIAHSCVVRTVRAAVAHTKCAPLPAEPPALLCTISRSSGRRLIISRDTVL